MNIDIITNNDINKSIIEILKSTILKLNYDNLYNFFDNSTDFMITDIVKIFYSDYFMFLTNNFFIKKNIFNFKKSLLKYFDKYNILYFNYENKNTIINLLNIFNTFIKYSNNLEKINLMNEIYKLNNISNDRLNNNFDFSKKLKLIYFSENSYEPNVLYKKIKFSNQEIFIPFNNYIIKKMEYKLRTFCQIAEKLGAEKIVINYSSSKNSYSKTDLNFNFLSESFGGNLLNDTHNNEDIQIIFEYSNYSDINLNKFSIINSIINENEFLITKEDFESDLELKFLIDASCVNFIQKYNTNFIINSINKIEKKIFLKIQNYGINIENINLNDDNIKISILIDFIKIQNNFDIIDGTNIHILREGFIHLSNIINKDKNYSKLLRFLQAHLNAIEKRFIILDYEFDNIDNINNIYNDIINLNFTEIEICNLLEKYFENNLRWHNFIKFRDIILRGLDDKLDKIYFISFQYNDILNNKNYIMNNIERYIDFQLNEFINSFKSISFDNYNDETIIINISNNNDDYFKILNFLNEYKLSIKNILYDSFKKSFKFSDGLSNNLNDLNKLIIIINNIINYYFDSNIKNLQSNLNKIIKDDLKYNIKTNVFNKLIELISVQIINNISLSNISPNLNEIENQNADFKLTLYKRIQKIFIKFITKYFNFENNINKVIKKLNLENENENLENDTFILFLNNIIPINKSYKNYNKFKLFYTWDDFNKICNYFNV